VSLSLSSLGLACLLIGVAVFWYDSMRVREAANVIAASACSRQGLQFLDGTVALSALRPRLAGGGLRLQRTYVFDYTVDGVLRASGFIIMLGLHLEHLGLAREH
jgi:hypothetical protein